MDVPTREELYAKVNEVYWERFPDAPRRLSRSDDDAAWRDVWLQFRDLMLNSETNRVYWELFPNAPEKLDPDNPDDNVYVNAWLEIRDAIISNSPLPPGDDDGYPDEDHDIDMSYARRGLYRGLDRALEIVDPDHHQEVREYFDAAFEEIRERALNGEIPEDPDVWSARSITVPTAEGGYPHEIQAVAQWRDGLLSAAAYQGADWTPD